MTEIAKSDAAYYGILCAAAIGCLWAVLLVVGLAIDVVRMGIIQEQEREQQ